MLILGQRQLPIFSAEAHGQIPDDIVDEDVSRAKRVFPAHRMRVSKELLGILKTMIWQVSKTGLRKNDFSVREIDKPGSGLD